MAVQWIVPNLPDEVAAGVACAEEWALRMGGDWSVWTQLDSAIDVPWDGAGYGHEVFVVAACNSTHREK